MRHLPLLPFLILPLAMAGEAPPVTGPGTAAGQSASTAAPGWLGIGLDEVDEALAYHLGLTGDLGVLIADVAPGTPAERAGLHRFDVITAIEGTTMYTPRAVREAVAGRSPGAVLRLTVRRGAQSVDLTATLGARPTELSSPGEAPGLMPMPGGDVDMRKLLERLRERRVNGAGPKHGRAEQPDGSVMEWSIEEQPPKGDGKSY